MSDFTTRHSPGKVWRVSAEPPVDLDRSAAAEAAVSRFIDCWLAANAAGYHGCSVVCLRMDDGRLCLSWFVERATAAGDYMHRLLHGAGLGIMPPAPDDVVARLRAFT